MPANKNSPILSCWWCTALRRRIELFQSAPARVNIQNIMHIFDKLKTEVQCGDITHLHAFSTHSTSVVLVPRLVSTLPNASQSVCGKQEALRAWKKKFPEHDVHL